MPCVYLITNLANGKLYVGKTNHAQRRWGQHLSAARNGPHRMLVTRAIRKYGEGRFIFDVLEIFETEDEALWWEGWWIEYLGSNNAVRGYNLDTGGHGGKTLSVSTRQKLSEANLGLKRSPETKAKLSAALVGRVISPDVRAKMSAAHKGKKRDPSIGAKVAKALQGRKLSPEHIARLSSSHRGKSPTPEAVAKAVENNRGRKRSPEVCAKISAAKKGHGLGQRNTPETIAKKAAAMRAWWASKRMQAA